MTTGVRTNLRVVLLVRSTRAPAWLADLAGVLLAADDFDVSALVVPVDWRVRPGHASPSRRRSERSAKACLRARFGRTGPEQDPFALVDLGQIAPALRVDVLGSDDRSPSGPPVDVAVAADYSLAKVDYSERGRRFRLGVWFSPELACRDGRAPSTIHSDPAGWQGLEHVAVTASAVEGGSQSERLVMAADIRLESVHPRTNLAEAAWGAASLVFAALEHASSDCLAAFTAPSADSSVPPSRLDERAPHRAGTPSAHRFGLPSRVGRVATAAVKRVALERQWLLAYHFGDAHTLGPTDDTRFVVPPADRYWADPHVVFAGGEYHVFYEEFSHRRGRGHIGTMRLGKSGPLDGSRVALKSDHHLSYPFVFAFEEEWFMIPESAEANRIDIFRAEAFPARWTRVMTLMDDVQAVDTTVVEHGGRWWLFTTIRRLGGSSSPLSHLYLFSADSPLSDVWEPHPMNPIASGAGGARAAGGIMTRQGRLVRPSQDSRVSYGGRIQLNEIVAMTPGAYHERPIGTLEPNGAKGFIGLHTVSQAGDLTVVDLCRWRTRLQVL